MRNTRPRVTSIELTSLLSDEVIEPPYNFVAIHQEWYLAVWSHSMRLSGKAICACVAYNTFGWHKDENYISYSQFMSFTGMSRAAVAEGIKEAVSAGFISARTGPRSKGNAYAPTLPKTDERGSLVGSLKIRPSVVQKTDTPYILNNPNISNSSLCSSLAEASLGGSAQETGNNERAVSLGQANSIKLSGSYVNSSVSRWEEQGRSLFQYIDWRGFISWWKKLWNQDLKPADYAFLRRAFAQAGQYRIDMCRIAVFAYRKNPSMEQPTRYVCAAVTKEVKRLTDKPAVDYTEQLERAYDTTSDYE